MDARFGVSHNDSRLRSRKLESGGWRKSFPGQHYDTDDLMNHNGAREYRPELGRYLQTLRREESLHHNLARFLRGSFSATIRPGSATAKGLTPLALRRSHLLLALSG